MIRPSPSLPLLEDLIATRAKICLDSGAVAIYLMKMPEKQSHVMKHFDKLTGVACRGLVGEDEPIHFKVQWYIAGTNITEKVGCFAVPGSTILCTISIPLLAKETERTLALRHSWCFRVECLRRPSAGKGSGWPLHVRGAQSLEHSRSQTDSIRVAIREENDGLDTTFCLC